MSWKVWLVSVVTQASGVTQRGDRQTRNSTTLEFGTLLLPGYNSHACPPPHGTPSGPKRAPQQTVEVAINHIPTAPPNEKGHLHLLRLGDRSFLSPPQLSNHMAGSGVFRIQATTHPDSLPQSLLVAFAGCRERR